MKVKIGSPEWLEMRRKYITATDASAIMGVNPWKTPLQLYEEKIKGTKTLINPAMQRGLDMEPMALLEFEQASGHFVQPQWKTHPDIKWMAATFDGINEDGIAVEIKCPGEKDHLVACEGKVPEKYYPQLQHQMKVAEIGQCYYFSYRPEFKIAWKMIRVEADRDYQQKMMEAEAEFYEGLQKKIAPKPCDRDVILRENQSWLRLENALFSVRNRKKLIEEEEDMIKKAMIDQCQGQASRGYRFKIAPVEIEGRVDYEAIPELKNVNLDQYRKPSSLQWRTYELKETK